MHYFRLDYLVINFTFFIVKIEIKLEKMLASKYCGAIFSIHKWKIVCGIKDFHQ